MLGEILQAILDECDALLSDTGAMVMLKTNFTPKKLPDNNGTFILLGIEDAPESGQYPGGLTQMDWKSAFNSYAYEPDAYVDDHSGFSTSLLDFIDRVRQHFSLAGLGRIGWLTPGMTNIYNTYGFQFTLQGLTTADPVDQDGLIMGYKIGFESTSFDNVTQYTEQDITLLTVTQIDNPPFSPGEIIS